MRRTWLWGVLALGLAGTIPASGWAADHRDGPTSIADPSTDINDVFTFLSDDGANLNVIMTVFPAATADSSFSDAAQYVMHIESGAALGALSPQEETNIICQFDAAGAAECWAGDFDYLTGDVSGDQGMMSEDGNLRVFAGLRNDPFFFKLDGFNLAREAVRDAAGSLTFDEFGCPALDAKTSAGLVGLLQSGDDFFAPLDTLAIAVQVPVSMVNTGGDVLGVWASTHMRPAN